MRISDIQKGQPAVAYKDTQTNIEAITSTEGMYAYATDIQKFGYYTIASGWVWQTEVPAGISSITVEDIDTTLSGITTLFIEGGTVESYNATTAKIIFSGGSSSNGDSFSSIKDYQDHLDGTLYPSSGVMSFIVDSTCTISGIYAYVRECPIGATTIIDVNKNGTTVFTNQSNRLNLSNAVQLDHSIPDVTSLSAGDIITVDIDSSSSNVVKDLTVAITVITESSIPTSSGTSFDSTAIHNNEANEIHIIAEKVTLADNDEFIIEDSADNYNKKRVKKSNLGAGGGAITAIYSASGTSNATVNPDPTSDTAINSMSVTFTLSAAKACIVSFYVRKAASHPDRYALYDGSTRIFPVITTPSDGIYDRGSAENNEYHASFRIIVSLASGEHTLSVKHQAAMSTDSIVFKERYLIVEVL